MAKTRKILWWRVTAVAALALFAWFILTLILWISLSGLYYLSTQIERLAGSA